jgi:hypothetical protein
MKIYGGGLPKGRMSVEALPSASYNEDADDLLPRKGQVSLAD